MTKAELVDGLRSVAGELVPFTQSVPSGSRVWNGTAYLAAEPRQPDPFALMWWSTLTAIAELIETQKSPLEPEQVIQLRKKLFGGMGSFNDYCIDEQRFGDDAKAANERLNEKRTKLFSIFS